ncbi:MAG: hypothetical protein EBT07_14035 [Actinobacteria bacterium]|nr:hypothetical protein [Actinomycetota bacterium]
MGICVRFGHGLTMAFAGDAAAGLPPIQFAALPQLRSPPGAIPLLLFQYTSALAFSIWATRTMVATIPDKICFI